MRDWFSSPGPILLFLRLLPIFAALLAIQAYGGYVAAVPELREPGVELHGRIRNWQLGEGYYVVLAVPEVRNRRQAVFPKNFDSAGIAADGSFALALKHEPRQLSGSGPELQALCPSGTAMATSSFHYLTVTQQPVSGELFNDYGLIRPVTGDPDQLVFFTFLSGLDSADDCCIQDGWNIVNVRQLGSGVVATQMLETAEFEWQLVR